MIAKLGQRFMSSARLTTLVAEAARTSRDAFVWDGTHDGAVKGFGLKITPAGKRVWLFQFWSPVQPGTRRRVTLGAYPNVTEATARTLAQQLAGRVAAGEDPAHERTLARVEARDATVERLATEYLAEIRPKKRPRTVESYESQLRLHLLPRLGKRPVAQVSHADVARLHASLSDKPVTANRTVALISAFMRWCERRGHRPRGSNPAADIDWYPERSRERFLTHDELARLGQALTRAEREGLPTPPELRRKPKSDATRKHTPKSLSISPANPFAVAAIRLLVLTGWRESEALSLRWAEVDFERGLVTLPETKTGKSHRWPGAPALSLLSELPRVAGNPYCFPGAKAGQPIREIRRVWYAARCVAGLPSLRLHDLRHSYASTSVGSGQSLYLTGVLLGHANPATTKKYAHLSGDVRRAAANAIGDEIAAALAGEPAEKGAESSRANGVVALRPTRRA